MQIGNKGKYQEGYVYLPYIIVESPAMVCGASKEWVRKMEIRKRNIKIQKLMDKLNG